ncbi:hypothetical protein E2C01_085718 [Portunus trituberculatus]|uniref:Uncharacterized protein n=1 Tax=Portunus trituberculatus TaxID=210409 RepID=A0A5B7IYV9_PORTR|nr:hypothetical protein [Portunus trituberculatus]
MEQCRAFSDILCVPPFTYDVEAWFLHLEAVWAGMDLPDLQQYQGVVRALPSEMVAHLYSVFSNLPEADSRPSHGAFGRSREACFAALNSARYDGSRLSALLVRLSTLNRAAGFPWSKEMMRHKLSSLLPQPVCLQLAAAPQALSLEEFSALVDRVHEAHVVLPPLADPRPGLPVRHQCCCPDGPANRTSGISLFPCPPATGGGDLGARRNPPLAAVPSSTETCLASVEAFLWRLEALLVRSPTQTDAGVCFYHRRFGEEAHSCRPPCAWPRQGNGVSGGC